MTKQNSPEVTVFELYQELAELYPDTQWGQEIRDALAYKHPPFKRLLNIVKSVLAPMGEEAPRQVDRILELQS